MKKIIPLLIGLFLLSGCGASMSENIPETVTSGEYKKLQTTIDVNLVHDGSSQVYTCTGSGAFMFDFYFPTVEAVNDGAEAVAQESYFQLTGYDCIDYSPYQALSSCVVTLPEEAYEPFPIDAEAELQFMEENGPMGEWLVSGLAVQNQGSMDLILYPTTQCQGEPATSPDPGTLNQIFSIFARGGGNRLDGFDIPLGDDQVDIWSVEGYETDVTLQLGNSAELVVANTISNVWEIPESAQ